MPLRKNILIFFAVCAASVVIATVSPLTLAQERSTNNPPQFLPLTLQLTIPENAPVYHQVLAIDDDPEDSVNRDSYSIIGGPDQGFFSMTETGLITAAVRPDFEHPQDSDGDNTYTIEIFVTSGTSDRERGTTAEFALTVTDVPDASPEPVNNLRITRESASCVRFAWEPPTSDGDSPLEGYLYQSFVVAAGGDWLNGLSGVTEDLYAERCNLDPGQTLLINVWAYNGDGDGPETQIYGHSDDCGGNRQDSCALTPGSRLNGRINLQPDRDWFAVTLQANTRYQIDVRGWGWPERGGTLDDPRLKVFDSTGDLIDGEEDDDSGAQKNARLFFTPTLTGTYHLQVTGNGEDNLGTYTVSAIRVPDNQEPKIYFGDVSVTVPEGKRLEITLYAGDYDVEDAITGWELHGADAGHFSIDNFGNLELASCLNFEVPQDADADNVYEFEAWVFSGDGERELSSGVDASVRVTDAEGEVPGPPVNVRIINEGLNSVRVAWEAPTENEGPEVTGYLQEYWQPVNGFTQLGDDRRPVLTANLRFLVPDTPVNVSVSALNDDGLGCGSPWLHGRTDDCGKGRDACPLDLEETKEARINVKPRWDYDFFHIDLEAGVQYRIDVKGRAPADPGGTLDDPRVLMFDSDLNRITEAADEDSGAGKNARLDFTPDTDGPYYVRVKAKETDDTGTYTVTVSDTTSSTP